MYSISPFPVVTTKTIVGFRIDRIEISLFKSAIITVILVDNAGSILDIKFLNMIGEDYSKWDADDTYVIEFIKQSLGFSSAPAAETPSAETQAAETQAAETQAADTQAAETPAAETQAAETPAAETQAAETPTDENVV